MISLGKRDHEFPSTLVASIHPYTLVRQALRAHKRDELEEEVWLRLEQIRRLFPDSRLKFFGVISWNSIPCLCFTPVHCVTVRNSHTRFLYACDALTIINGVGVVVLPCQTR